MNYFISVGLRPEGPLSLGQVKAEIAKGVIGPYDLVMREGESWISASELPEFPFELFPAGCFFEDEAGWVLLLKVEDKYQQEGPFSEAEIKRLIQERVVQWETRAWREGLGAWIKLSDRPEFRDALISLGL